jgi:hypothetical protein
MAHHEATTLAMHLPEFPGSAPFAEVQRAPRPQGRILGDLQHREALRDELGPSSATARKEAGR